MDILLDFLEVFKKGGLRVLLILFLFVVVERRFFARKYVDASSLIFNVKWIFVYGVLGYIFTFLAVDNFIPFLKNTLGLTPLLQLPRPGNIYHEVFYWYLSFIYLEFFYYWLHRMQHEVPFLWSMHKFHHSERQFQVSTAVRNHLFEIPINSFCIYALGYLILDFQLMYPKVFLLGVSFYSYLAHMNVRLHLGRLGLFIGGPQIHRLHHSFLRQHINKNYSTFFPLWDKVFGTLVLPEKDEYVDTGLSDGGDCSLSDGVFSPFEFLMNKFKRDGVGKRN
ncbi:hypothetical protein BIY24_01740 [Halobacteriovorax marinus]|uniref:sterol desaturase family protein n=1 Tax=Halobacteriovorax marinus TaxID=97084 RepID=UPI000BC2CA11|nr:sterol desaturase family protein [Halobacteriovorax marinus]ATH06704.1 hypothetical protein BIY24_01740 [Halobacteriovorax marinus]